MSPNERPSGQSGTKMRNPPSHVKRVELLAIADLKGGHHKRRNVYISNKQNLLGLRCHKQF